jgi:transposase
VFCLGRELLSKAGIAKSGPRATKLLRRKPAKLVAVAMANKAARVAWAVMTRGEIYRAPQPSSQQQAAA